MQFLDQVTLSRRQLFVIGASLTVTACTNTSGTTSSIPIATVSAQVASDVGLIATGLTNALPGLQASGAVSPSAVTKVSQAVGQIQTLANAVTTGTPIAQGQSTLQQIETLLNTIVSALAGMSLPAPFGPALSAASVLLPVAEIGVGIAVSAVNNNAPGAAAMTPAQARVILASIR